jgi:transitional endoplasmic reticulum ATPase
MSQTLKTAHIPEAVIVAEVVKSGEKLIIPENCSLTQARDLIERRMEYEQEVVSLQDSFDVFPWDGAVAFDAVLTDVYGWSPAESTPGFWGDTPPQMQSVEVGPGVFRSVPWGRFSLPNVKGWLHTAATQKEGRYVFAIVAQVLRKDEGTVKNLFSRVREYLKTGSIYRGQAIRMRFRNDEGATLPLPEPKFMRTDDIDPAQLIYSRSVTESIETNLFTPIKRVRELKANGIAVKRGVLLGGVYGTGKTMAAKVASKYAVESGVSFLYVTRADELADAINFARQYQDPACVIFCEDIDRVMDGERDIEMDDILNVIDGIDTKSANIITVLTTNNLEGIHAAMLRPGRLDAVIDVKAPDAEAIQRLLRVYGGDAIDASEDLSRVGMLLDGNIPAVIAEVVKRAKLSQLKLNEPGVPVTRITAQALEDAAETMQGQLDLLFLQSAPKDAKPDLVQALDSLVQESVIAATEEVVAQVKRLKDAVEEM